MARVGRLSFQEFFLDSDTDEENMSPFLKVVTNKYFATVITLVLAYMLTKVGYAEIWPLFGSANQLLSVLALVACAVFLKKTKRQGCILWIPMVFMMAVTFTALGMTITKLSKALLSTGLDLGNTLQLVFAVLLLILGVLVAIQGVKKLFEKNDEKQTPYPLSAAAAVGRSGCGQRPLGRKAEGDFADARPHPRPRGGGLQDERHTGRRRRQPPDALRLDRHVLLSLPRAERGGDLRLDPQPAARLARPSALVARDGHCLLYTSDAADE